VVATEQVYVHVSPGLSLVGDWSPFFELSVGVAPHRASLSERLG
jgi:hypothetical protein